MAEKIDKVIIFRIDNKLYGLEITDVQGIEPLSQITELGLPNVPDFIAGIFNLRGEVVPLIDSRKKLSISSSKKGDDSLKRVLLNEVDNGKVGIIVDEVREIYEFDEKDIHPLPTGVGGLSANFVKGIGKFNENLIIILDIDVFVTADEKFDLEFMDDLEDYLSEE